MMDANEKSLLLKVRQIAEREWEIEHKDSGTLSFFSNAWFYTMIVAFIGIALYFSNISQMIGSFVAIGGGSISIVCFIVAMIASHDRLKEKKKYVEMSVAIESERLGVSKGE